MSVVTHILPEVFIYRERSQRPKELQLDVVHEQCFAQRSKLVRPRKELDLVSLRATADKVEEMRMLVDRMMRSAGGELE